MTKENDRHHIIPKSRKGRTTVTVPVKFHQAWHTIFGSLYGEETIRFVKGVNDLFDSQVEITLADLESLRRRCRYG